MKAVHLAKHVSRHPVHLTGITSFVTFCVVFWSTIVSMPAIWLRQEDYTIGFAAPIFIVWSFLIQWRYGKHITVRPSTSGIVLFLVAFAGWWTASALFITIGAQLALILMIWSLVWAFMGRHWVFHMAMPLGMMIFLVPFGDVLLPHLQWFTAKLAIWMLDLSGILFHADRFTITLPGGIFYVAEECAGVRFLFATLMVGTFYAWLAFPDGKRRFQFLLLCVLVPIVGNAMRAAGIVLIAYMSDHQLAAGVDHLVYGWIFFALLMALLLQMGTWMGGDIRRDMANPYVSPDPARTSESSGHQTAVAVLIVVLALALGFPPDQSTYRQALHVNPPEAMTLVLKDSEQFKMTGQGNFYRQFSTPSKAATFVFTSYDRMTVTKDRGSMAVLSAQRGDVDERVRVVDVNGWGRVKEVTRTNTFGFTQILQYAYLVDGTVRPSAMASNLDVLLARLQGRKPHVAVAILSTSGQTEMEARANMTMQDSSWSSFRSANREIFSTPAG